MSGPQIENGYTRLANELLDAIVRHPFTKREYKIVLAVIRRTYGWNKKLDTMSLSQIANMTGIDRAHVQKSVSGLVKNKVLLKQPTPDGFELGINKSYGEWKLLPKQPTRCQNSLQRGGQNSLRGVGQNGNHKRNINTNKDNIVTSEFENAWKQYPKRSGSNPKHDALKAWNARIREGQDAKELSAGTARYAEYCRATGKTGTEFVMQAKRFYGPSKQYLETWELPKQTEGIGAKAARLKIEPRPGESQRDYEQRVANAQH